MSRKPNVVVILTDDQGYGDLSCTGNTNLNTPNIDQLSSDGATLDYFYVQPMCAPTRAEFLTGRYYPRTGVRGVTRRAERINLDEETIADVFSADGYRTGCFGKWHSGLQYPYHPNGRGFEEFVGYCCGHWSHYFDSTIERNGQEYCSEGYLTDALTDAAIDFIIDNADQPFFCYVPLNTPHSPFQVPDEYFNRFDESNLELKADDCYDENLTATRTVLAMCENIDYNVGRIVNALDETGLSEDTIVIYFSDNGPNTYRWNAGLSGKKCDAEEGGVRSPCFIKWPGAIPGGHVIKEISGAIDLLPTLTELCDVPWQSEKEIDGCDLSSLLKGGSEAHPDRMIFAREVGWQNDNPTVSVRTNRFRAGGNLGGLYDIWNDPGQRVDVHHENSETYNALMAEIETFKDSMPTEVSDPVIPVGYDAFPYTDLPVQDAELTGDVTWSSIHPNASYLIEWNSVEDRVQWEIQVMKEGRYKVLLRYTCSEESIGTEIMAGFGDNTVTGQIKESYQSSPKDKDDRVKRDEAYEKDFMTAELGILEMVQGKGSLEVKAVRMTGNNVCDLRGVRLVLLEA